VSELIYHPLQLGIGRFAVIHQPVEQIRIVVFQQANEQRLSSLSVSYSYSKNGMMEISSSRIPRRHAQ
jgi:O-phosphoseryl-tRNA(Cys) synthetase